MEYLWIVICLILDDFWWNREYFDGMFYVSKYSKGEGN